MKNTPKIKYAPLYTPEDLQERIDKLREALSEALLPLQCLEVCGAAEIADEEACYVQEMQDFVELINLVESEELAAAIDSVDNAREEIDHAAEESATDVEHPWFDEETGGSNGTQTFSEEEMKREENSKSSFKPSDPDDDFLDWVDF